MIIKSLDGTAAFAAGDDSLLKELLHPGKEPLAVRFSLAHAEVGAGRATRPHRLAGAEVYVILAGRGRMHVGAESAEVGPGQTIYIPPGEVQYIESAGPGPLRFLCIVDPAWTAAGEDVL